MRPRTAGIFCTISALAVLFAGAGGCAGTPEPAPAPVPASAPKLAETVVDTARGAAFSADRAWAHLLALTQIGPRTVRSEGSEKARQYIVEQLRQAKLEPRVDARNMFEPMSNSPSFQGAEDVAEAEEEAAAKPQLELPTFVVKNVVVEIPGTQSEDKILLFAPYDSQEFEDFTFVGANDGASGAAVLLEMARVIAAAPLPFTTQIVFVDAHAPFQVPEEEGPRKLGGEWLVGVRLQEDEATRVRMAVYLNRVGDGDLRIARDLLSHRIYREQFWSIASKTGQEAAFPPDAPFESTGLEHKMLSLSGVRRVVSLVDTRYGGEEPPGLYADSAEDTPGRCAPESLASVGIVALGGVEHVSEWLLRIDLFTSLGQVEPEPAPGAEPGANTE
jgi:hypothetical protein